MRKKHILFGLAIFGLSNTFCQTQTEPSAQYTKGTFLGITPPVKDWKGTEVDFSSMDAKDASQRENRRRPEVDPAKKDIFMDGSLQESFGMKANKAPIVNFDGSNDAAIGLCFCCISLNNWSLVDCIIGMPTFGEFIF